MAQPRERLGVLREEPPAARDPLNQLLLDPRSHRCGAHARDSSDRGIRVRWPTTIGLSALGVASALSLLGHAGWAQFVSALLYPVGFLAVILGRAQLFTENTLYPVVLVLEDRRHVAPTRPNFWSGVVAGWIIALIAWLVEAGVGHLLAWLAAVTAGNIIGGVLIVAVLNVGQVRSH
jgi:formate/nitrite transporter FocA (FNT family)